MQSELREEKMCMRDDNNNEILIYQSENGMTKIEVTFIDETVWLSQQQMAELFQTSRTNVVEHIKHIYEEGELEEESTCRKFRQVRKEGRREVVRELPFYTSVDYNPKSSESIAFFKMVQNKLHFAAHGHTAAEVIYERADAEQPFMGLRTFSGDFPTKKDIGIAKNYLDEKELKVLNNSVSGYFDFAEIQAMRHNPMYMSDYVEHLDKVLSATGENLLLGAGSISHAQAIAKANEEYQKYQTQNLSPVEEEYLLTIKNLEKQVKTKR